MNKMKADRLADFWSYILLLCGLFQVTRCGVKSGIQKNTFQIMYLIPWSHEWSVGPEIGSAVDVALDFVQATNILPGYGFSVTFRDTWCKAEHGVHQALDMWEGMEDVDFVLGDGCSVVCEPTALLSAVWNIPQVSYGCNSAVLSQKEVYPTFVRTVGPWTLLSPMFDAIADLWGHTRIGIVAESSELMRDTAEHVKDHLESQGKIVYYRVLDSTVQGSITLTQNYLQLREWVQFLKDRCRAIFIFSYGNDVRNTLIAAHELQMLNGDYLFASLEVTPIVHSPWRQGWLYRNLGPELFNGLLIGNPFKRTDAVYDLFRRDVIDAFQRPTWANMKRLAPNATLESVISYAALVYDSVLLWAYAVKKTLDGGGEADDGKTIAKNMIGLEFDGMSGKVGVNEKGDRLLEFTIDIPQDGHILTIAKWMGHEHKIKKLYKPNDPNDWSGLKWGRNSTVPPKSHPPCGWNGEICIPGKIRLAIVILLVMAVTAAIIAVASWYIWKFYVFRRDLNRATDCCVKWESVVPVRSVPGPGNELLNSINESGSKQTEVVKFDDEYAILRKLGAINVDVDNFDIRLELKCMRDVSCKNLNPFLGIVIASPNACIVMAYASRGSLQDVMRDDNVVLTWELKLHLTHDVCRGLLYIHTSSLQYHGHLTSANCVVDSQFVCKITDYGFHKVRSQAKLEIDDDEMIFRKLWYAPELLRGGGRPSTETDIYAFAIICQEILLEGPPYCENDPKRCPPEIVKLVEDYDTDPPYRPVIPEGLCPFESKTGLLNVTEFLDYPGLSTATYKFPDQAGYEWREMVKECWRDQPSARLPMKQVLLRIKGINGGQPLNIDNMVHLMYRHNRMVEKKVDDKYEALENEKNKLNTLLMELLPKSVAEELMLSGSHNPETFDCVTICFAYNVDFTSTCVQWSPGDIVSTLNRMYTVLDEVTSQFDVYKVATVGDSLMVASGVPNRNGSKHAEEICGMAARFQEAVQGLRFPHLRGKSMRLRCGVHTGSVIAGIAGVKVPRYLLFGNTVDYAAKMETSGEPGKIHISQATHQLLDTSVFQVDYRWEIDLRGFGRMKTYWLSKTYWENW